MYHSLGNPDIDKEGGRLRIMMTTKAGVRELLISLNEFKLAGPDELHHRVLKKLVECVWEPLQ